MDELIQISRRPPELKSQDYAFLREGALDVIRSLSAETWTDHNLHDPGITLLEAFCYALTEAGLRVGMDVVDLIATSRARRDPEYFTAAQVLPSSPSLPTTSGSCSSITGRRQCVDIRRETPPFGQMSILLEFEEENLNSNTFAIQVEPPALAPSIYEVDLAFPHWDDEDVVPLREDVVLQAVVFDGATGSEWNPIEGGQSYFSRITLTYQPPGGGPSSDIQIWIVAQITTELENSTLESPLILAEVTAAIGTLVPANLSVLRQLNQRVTAAHEAMRTIRRFVHTHRNLCEEIVELNAVREQEIALSGIIEVGDSVNIENLLAAIFLRLDQMISPEITPRTLQRQLDDLESAEAVFDGPLLHHGFLSDDDLDAATSTHTLFVSDILRVIYQSRSVDEMDVLRREDIGSRTIVAVRNLSLSNYLDNRLITTTARDCLQLVKSRRHVSRLSVTKSRIVIYRNGIEVDYDKGRVLELFQQGKVESRALDEMGDNNLGLPPGQPFPFADYYPIQNDLPRIYGVGESGLPEHATVQRQAQAMQLKGFLLLFEQMIAGYHSQLEHFNAFFSADSAIDRTLFQQNLYHIPGIRSIIKAFDPQTTTWDQFQDDKSNAYAAVLRHGVESREQFLIRRNAVLDHLLAALGESMKDRTALLLRLATEVQNGSSLSLPDLLEAQSRQRLEALDDLIRDKAQYYFDLPELNKNKAQAFGNPLWRAAHLVRISAATAGYQWEIVDENEIPVLKHFEPPSPATVTLAASLLEARCDAEEAIRLATNVDVIPSALRVEGSGVSRSAHRHPPSRSPNPWPCSTRTRWRWPPSKMLQRTYLIFG